jgi:hypothetical protein
MAIRIHQGFLLVGYFLGVACLAGCGNSHLETARHLADVAIAEADMPEHEVVTIDHLGDQMRSYELDARGHELIPPVEVDAAVSKAIDALASEDDDTYQQSATILRKFGVPVDRFDEPMMSGEPNVIIGVPQTPRSAFSQRVRQWWEENRSHVRYYRKTTDAPPGGN